MSKLNAAQLLKTNRARMAYAIAMQIQRTVPKYQEVDRLAIASNVESLIDGVHKLLRSGDQRALMGMLDLLMELRHAGGFEMGDFLVAVLCALPVMRRFYVQHSSSIEKGLETYEEVEAIVLPLYGQMVSHFPELRDSQRALHTTDADRDVLPWEIVSLEDADDELTEPNGKHLQ